MAHILINDTYHIQYANNSLEGFVWSSVFCIDGRSGTKYCRTLKDIILPTQEWND